MPVRRDIKINLTMDQVLRRQEIGAGSKPRPSLMAILREQLDSINELDLLEPAIAYEFHLIKDILNKRLSLAGSQLIDNFNLPPVLAGAEEVAVVVCTIGPRLEAKVSRYSCGGETLRALLLDGIGSAAIDFVTQEACHLISNETSSRGLQTSSPVSPGMPGFPLSDQEYLFQLVSAEQIGVSLTRSQVMIPRKAFSMVIGLGVKMPTWTQAEVCGRCGLRKTCLHRVSAVDEAKAG